MEGKVRKSLKADLLCIAGGCLFTFELVEIDGKEYVRIKKEKKEILLMPKDSFKKFLEIGLSLIQT